MTKLEITFLTSKVLGVFIIMQSLAYFHALGSQLSLADVPGFHMSFANILFFTLIPLLLTLSAGLILFFYSDRCAKFFMSHSDNPATDTPLVAQEIEIAAFSILGLYLIIQALPTITRTVVWIYFSIPSSPQRMVLSRQIQMDIAVIIVELTFGVWLLPGSRGITKAVRWLRQIGT